MGPRTAGRTATSDGHRYAFPTERQFWAWWAAELRAGRPR
jgi:hypothetical protein